MLICVFCFFQLGIFVDVKTVMIVQFVLETFTPEWKLLSVSIQCCLFSLKIEDTILNPGLTHL